MTGLVAYPLQWPVGRARTQHRKVSNFRVSSFAGVRDGLLKEIRLMSGANAVISSNVALRKDGAPYASQQDPDDPGVAVYWHNPTLGQQLCMACDCWRDVLDNFRALEKTINAMRGLDRWGASEVAERAFRGFAALPEPVTGWREVLQFKAQESVSQADVKTRYHELAREHHPDHGGSHEAMLNLNESYDAALVEVAT